MPRFAAEARWCKMHLVGIACERPDPTMAAISSNAVGPKESKSISWVGRGVFSSHIANSIAPLRRILSACWDWLIQKSSRSTPKRTMRRLNDSSRRSARASRRALTEAARFLGGGHVSISRYGWMTWRTRQTRAASARCSSVNCFARQPSRRASTATSNPISCRYLKQSATVLAGS